MALVAERVKLLDTENAFKIGPYIRQLEAQGKRVIKCNLGEPDFPVPAVHQGRGEAADRPGQHPLLRSPGDPLPPHGGRRALQRNPGDPRPTPERVVVFPGAKPPIGFCQQTYCDPGDEVVYPSPGFPIYESFIPYVGATRCPSTWRRRTRFTLSGEELAPAPLRADQADLPQFPLQPHGRGRLPGAARRDRRGHPEALREGRPGLFRRGLRAHPLRRRASHHSIVSCPGMEERTILVSGASKSFAWTGGRIGWALFPTAEEAEVFRNLNINYFSCVARLQPGGGAAGAGIPAGRQGDRRNGGGLPAAARPRGGGAERHPGRALPESRRGPSTCSRTSPGSAGSSGSWRPSRAFRRTCRRTSPSTLFQMFLLFEYQVATLDRKSFGRIGTEHLHYLRLSIATDTESLQEGLNRFAEAAQDKDGFGRFFSRGEHLA